MVMIKVEGMMSSDEALALSKKFNKEGAGFKATPGGVLYYVPDATRDELISVITEAGYEVAREEEKNE